MTPEDRAADWFEAALLMDDDDTEGSIQLLRQATLIVSTPDMDAADWHQARCLLLGALVGTMRDMFDGMELSPAERHQFVEARSFDIRMSRHAYEVAADDD